MTIYTELQLDLRIFRKSWTCPSHINTKLRRTIRVSFPPKVAYRPGHSNKHPVFIKTGLLNVWLIDPFIWKHVRKKPAGEISARSSALRNYLVEFRRPYERPERPMRVCLDWMADIQRQTYAPQCPPEKGKLQNTKGICIHQIAYMWCCLAVTTYTRPRKVGIYEKIQWFTTRTQSTSASNISLHHCCESHSIYINTLCIIL